MTLAEFKATLSDSAPPAGVRPALTALWHDARGHWDQAHSVAQDIEDKTGSWVHAYLHRKEGDLSNAAYWYRRAGRPAATCALMDEWSEIVEELLRSIEE